GGIRRRRWLRGGLVRQRTSLGVGQERREAETVAKWRSRKKSRHKYLGNQGLVTHHPLRHLTAATWRTRQPLSPRLRSAHQCALRSRLFRGSIRAFGRGPSAARTGRRDCRETAARPARTSSPRRDTAGPRGVAGRRPLSRQTAVPQSPAHRPVAAAALRGRPVPPARSSVPVLPLPHAGAVARTGPVAAEEAVAVATARAGWPH